MGNGHICPGGVAGEAGLPGIEAELPAAIERHPGPVGIVRVVLEVGPNAIIVKDDREAIDRPCFDAHGVGKLRGVSKVIGNGRN